CTRIAVLNQGRMVFEGPLAATKQLEKWVHLKVGDFPSAVQELRKAKLLANEREGHLVALAPDVGTDQIVRFLVERGMPVYEIAPHEETLENFYLRLMKSNGEAR